MRKEALILCLKDLIAISRLNELRLDEDKEFWASAAYNINECLQHLEDDS